MKISKSYLTMLITLSLFGISGCTEADKDKAEEAKKEAAAKYEQAKEKAAEAIEEAKDGASDTYDSAKETATDAYNSAKESAEDMMDTTEEEAAELKAEAARKMKEACITAKEETGGDPEDCE